MGTRVVVRAEGMQKFIHFFLKLIGAVLVVLGMVAAYYGPLEIYVFYLFSEGGLFHYPGFGVGSFWFAALVLQNLGYYIVAALFIPVGIGHVKLRRWALTLMQLYLWFWLVTGLLLAVNLLLLMPVVLNLEISPNVLLPRVFLVSAFALISLILLPALSLWFYKSQKVRATFEIQDAKIYWTECYPFPLLALLLLFIIMILVMHLAIFFQVIFPWFGQFILGRQSIDLIALCILILGVLIYGIVQLKKWAWWGALMYLALLSTSALLSFSRHSFSEILQMMDLPAYEIEFLGQLTLLSDFHLTLLAAAPLFAGLGLLIYSKRFFDKQGLEINR